MPTMYIIRGIPGSGKSTLAEVIAQFIDDVIICEADDYFYTNENEYQYDSRYVGDAHNWCFNKAAKGCIDRKHVIISNTSIKDKFVKQYINLAKEHMYDIQIITCQSTFKNIHTVPEEVMDSFKRKMQYKAYDI